MQLMPIAVMMHSRIIIKNNQHGESLRLLRIIRRCLLLKYLGAIQPQGGLGDSPHLGKTAKIPYCSSMS